ncbi:serine/threonine-protein kinase Rio1 [Halodesulfurarchaeum formicicum]|uniref:non-specific serine/threonine protein kinase n=1 Tax=Halodesulfurarchaeum formicicum TaxID=1873524 RepID=A0A1J1A957_9EURY|nr:serine/threonine-protein kinase Rio1 [Halodesulfurarchaeum formicicum]APE94644.1 serine/threonine protein kinase [Halodesulfurarchaeum formicicum]
MTEFVESGDSAEWEEIEVRDTEADRIARRQDREFSEFRKRLKDTEQFKVEGSVFDDATYAALYKLVQDDYLQAFGGPISTGKEANVYEAIGEDGETVAVKVYLTTTSNFQQMSDYLAGDPRFEGIRGTTTKVVIAWVRKEFSNLRRAREAGVAVPDPIAVQRNVLVMEYLGDEDGPAPTLDEVEIENPETAFSVVREYMRRLYDAGLVHGDLSEYNLVVHDGQITVIDVGQAVTVHHPNAEDFLERDCKNVASFFADLGVDVTTDSLRAYLDAEASPP